jgi:hypothetical protein
MIVVMPTTNIRQSKKHMVSMTNVKFGIKTNKIIETLIKGTVTQKSMRDKSMER